MIGLHLVSNSLIKSDLLRTDEDSTEPADLRVPSNLEIRAIDGRLKISAAVISRPALRSLEASCNERIWVTGV